MQNLNRQKYFKVAGVYVIKANNNKNFYIGSSNNLYSRINSHKKKLSKGEHCNKRMQSYYNKYGKDSLNVEIIETYKYNISVKELLNKEQEYLDLYYNKYCFNAHYKVSYYDDNPPMREYNRNHSKLNWKDNYDKLLPYVMKNLEKARASRKKLMDEGKLKIESPMKGKKHKEESKMKMSKSAKERGRHDSNLKKIYMYDLNGVYIKAFDCIKDAVRYLELDERLSSNISSCAYGNRSRACGYIWRFDKQDILKLNLTLLNITINESIQFLAIHDIAKYLKCDHSVVSRGISKGYTVLKKYKILKNN
jgi:group I intron endonuclease